MKSKRVVIVDGNNLAYASYYAMAGMRYMGYHTSMIYGLPNAIKASLAQFNPDKLIICWDGPRSKERLELVPEYKQGRKTFTEEAKKDFYDQMRATNKLLNHLGILTHKDNMEADDLIYYHTKRYLKKGYKVVIVSNDKDFHQLISPRVKIYQPTKKRILTYKNYSSMMGIEPTMSVDYLCLTGDSSDNIPGYPRVGEKTAKKLLEKHGSVEGIIKYLEGVIGGKEGILEIKRLTSIYERNRFMIDLAMYHKITKHKPEGKPKRKKPNIDKLYKICAKYGIRTFLQTQFLKHFKIQ